MKCTLILSLLLVCTIYMVSTSTIGLKKNQKITSLLSKVRARLMNKKHHLRSRQDVEEHDWPVVIDEILVEGFGPSGKNTPCRQREVCREWSAIKDNAIQVLALRKPLADTEDVYYVFTMEHSQHKRGFGQFLFAFLPKEQGPVAEGFAPKIVSVCVPVNKMEQSFEMTNCPLDPCSRGNEETQCQKAVDQSRILIKFKSRDDDEDTEKLLEKEAHEKWPEQDVEAHQVQVMNPDGTPIAPVQDGTQQVVPAEGATVPVDQTQPVPLVQQEMIGGQGSVPQAPVVTQVQAPQVQQQPQPQGDQDPQPNSVGKHRMRLNNVKVNKKSKRSLKKIHRRRF